VANRGTHAWAVVRCERFDKAARIAASDGMTLFFRMPLVGFKPQSDEVREVFPHKVNSVFISNARRRLS
jgi:hypothetical protein